MNTNPAFPISGGGENLHPDWWGMTLRDYFAGQALAGWLASYGGRSVSLCDLNHDVIANGVYMMADAMLKAREVQP